MESGVDATAPGADGSAPLYVIACEVFRDELLHFEHRRLAFRFLPQGYHRTPGRMPPAIQDEIDRAPADAAAIVLGYGLCSNGVVGLRSSRAPLVLPRVHDCIAMLLGSRQRYEEEATRCPGTYYLTRGWIEYGKTPYSEYRDVYLARYDEETAAWIARETLKDYQRVVLVDHGLGPMERYRKEAQEMADFFGLAFEEMPGSLDYIRRLLSGPWNLEDFLVIRPGQSVDQAPYLCLNPLCLP